MTTNQTYFICASILGGFVFFAWYVVKNSRFVKTQMIMDKFKRTAVETDSEEYFGEQVKREKMQADYEAN